MHWTFKLTVFLCRYSERGKLKCVGITIETRPDYCLAPHLSDMLNYGCTRLEIGVQSVYEDVARDTNRGHTIAAVTDCFRVAKDTGYKIVTHMVQFLWIFDKCSFFVDARFTKCRNGKRSNTIR